MKPNELTIKEALIKLRSGELSSFELTNACLMRIKELNADVNACITICEKEAIDAAKQADERIRAGEHSELLGIPFLVKDNIMTKGVRTTAASKILSDYIAPYDATVVLRLKQAGAIMLGKTNLDEFAHGASTEYSYFGATKNPWDMERVPGGSSGGSAAAVISDMCMFALGTDTGGSVRGPASFCGVVGMKPSYGRASRYGLISMTSSTDVPGVLAKTSEDASLVLRVMSGCDAKDASSSGQIIDWQEPSDLRLDGVRIGLVRSYFENNISENTKDQLKKVLEKYIDLGAKIVDIELPHDKFAIPVYYIITPSEISSNLARFDGVRFGVSEAGSGLTDFYQKTRGRGFGSEVKRRIMLGTYVLSAGYYDAYYLRAQKVRTKIITDYENAWKKADVILSPTSTGTAFRLGEQAEDPWRMYLEDIFLAGSSLAGLPAISIPAGFVDDLPIGIQIIGKKFDEENVFKVAYAYEQSEKWYKHKVDIKKK